MSSTRFEVEEGFAFIGRTFGEYCRLFDLEWATFARGPILDCAGGPSSFAAVASTLTPVTAVDPRYGPPVATLEAACRRGVADTRDQLREKADAFVWDVYGDVETRVRYLEAATRRFLADYGHEPGRYVRARLPSLPLDRDAFAVALCGNFLFLYDDRLDLSLHVAALRELARVAREVRVFPLHGLDGDRSPYVDPAVEHLADRGLVARIEPVPYEFQPGATEMLVVRS